MSHITISRKAFFHNLTLLCEKLGSKEKLSIVLKDNAYGHGLTQVATLAHEFGLIRAIVRTYDEAEEIRNLFAHIIVLAPKTPHIYNSNYSVVINNLSTLSQLPIHTKVELKIDTGMHRNGLAKDDLEEAFSIIQKRHLILSGVMTHFRSADVLSSELFWQIKTWTYVKQTIKNLCNIYAMPIPLFHSANSATVLRLKEYHDNFARCGIAAYGYHEVDPIFDVLDLHPILELHTHKISTLQLNKYQRIGYGGSFTAQKKMTVSTYDIGYGDGFFRFNGNGHFITNGYKILGKISMDSLSVEGAHEEIIILKDAKEIAHFFDTISYEVLVKLSARLKRVIVH